MQMSEAKFLAQKPTYLSVTKGADGVWASAGAHALRSALKDKSAKSVMELLKPMDAHGMAHVFREVGFNVDPNAVAKGRNALFESIKPGLQKALSNPAKAVQQPSVKPLPTPVAQQPEKIVPQTALESIQSILRSPNIVVSTFGEVPMPQRASLQMVAGQALEKGILGFGFDGIQGKYMVSAPMKDVVELHKEAAKNVATESAKASLQKWSKDEQVSQIHDFVPDSIQRLLQGSLSMDAAQVIMGALDSGSIAHHAEEIAEIGISNLLAERGLDVDAATVDLQAQELGYSFKSMDTERGMYFGSVVGQDHRASIIKVNKNEVVELVHSDLPLGKPQVGEQLRIEFKAGELKVSSRNAERAAVER